MQHATARLFEDFLGAQVMPIVANNLGRPWCKKVTAAAGSPTMAGVASEATGGLKTLLASTNEAEIMTLYWGDILSIKWSNILSIGYRLKATAITTAESLVFGVASAQNDTEDSVAYNAWFKLAATSDILVETDDASTDDDDNDTGLDITAATYKEYVIDFRNGLADVRFFVSGTGGYLERVLAKTTFSLAGAAATYLQPFMQLAKTTGTTVPYCTIDWIDIEYKR